MKIHKTKSAAWIAGAYLLVALAVASLLIRDGYIGHGNGLAFLLATVLTSPLSLILFLVNDALSDVNAFYMTGWAYLITLCELAAGALLNACSIYVGVAFLQRKWHKA